jgi:RND family efflux transporter MFP subunit
VVALTLTAAVATSGCKPGGGTAASQAGTGDESVLVEVITAGRGDVFETIEVTGTVEALDKVDIASPVGEKITYIVGREGTRVHQGELVAQLETGDLDASIAQAAAQRDSAQVRLEQARQGHTYVDVSTQNQIDSARTQRDAARARLVQAQKQRDLRQSSVADGISLAQTRVTQANARYQQAQSARAQAEQATQAGIASAQAVLDQSTAAFEDLRHGARSQERKQAEERVKQAELAVDNTRRDLQRMVSLKDAGAVSQQTVDGLRLQYDTAVSQLTVAQQALSLVQEGPTQEQLQIAQHRIDQAQAGLATARSQQGQVDQTRKGEQIAREDVTAAEIALTDAQSQKLLVDTANKDIEVAETAVQSAELAVQQAEAGKIKVGVDEKEIRAAEAMLRGSQATIALYAAQRAKRTMISPVDGVVSKKQGEVGGVTGSGEAVLTIVTDDALEFAATVSELDVSRVIPGDEVDVTVDGLQDTKITGRVVSVLPAGDAASRNFTIKVTVPGSTGVRPGMFARGIVRVKAARGAVTLPKDALIEQDGTFIAYVVDGNVASRRQVVVGLQGAGMVEVLEGIQAGETVVIHGKERLSDQSPVKVAGTLRTDPATGQLIVGGEAAGDEAAPAAEAPPPTETPPPETG